LLAPDPNIGPAKPHLESEIMKTASSLLKAQKIRAVKEIHAEFIKILKHEKCRSCSCLYGDVLSSVFEKIKKFRKSESDYSLVEIENDFERWTREADLLKMHG
jgi:hypothetical protein